MSENETYAEKIINIIAEQFDVENGFISAETVMDELGGGYHEYYAIEQALEAKFDITIQIEVFEQLKTVGEIIKYVKRKIKEVAT